MKSWAFADTVGFKCSAHGTQEISCIWLLGWVLREDKWEDSNQIHSWTGSGGGRMEFNLPIFGERTAGKLNGWPRLIHSFAQQLHYRGGKVCGSKLQG